MQIQIRMAALKPTVFRLYLNEENASKLVRICKKTELSQAELLSRATVAALRAIEENEDRVSLPLRFKIMDAPTPYRQRDTTPVVMNEKKR